MGAIYSAPVYDLDSIFYSAKKITGHEYTLQNILKYGGVCGDRAHFSANVARACGIPAVTLSHGKESGLGHAWTGYIQPVQPGSKSGRSAYNWDLTVGGGDYATFGKTRDPRTGKRLHDYELPMITAECTERPEAVRTSSAYTTLARVLVEAGKFAPATQALEQAIKSNKFNLTAWTMIGQLFKEASFTEGSFDAGYADRIMDETLKMFPDKPDFCYGAFTTLMGMIPPEEYDRRVRLYKQAVELFKSRPNLTVAVGRDYGDFLLEADKKREAYRIYFNTITALMEKPEFAADVAIKFVDTKLEGDEPQRAVTLLQSVLKRTKKPKYNDPFARFSPWYRLQTSLRDVYASAGRKKESDAVEADLSHFSMRDK
jgi:tetratricopeptide (TPR) repeat protein